MLIREGLPSALGKDIKIDVDCHLECAAHLPTGAACCDALNFASPVIDAEI